MSFSFIPQSVNLFFASYQLVPCEDSYAYVVYSNPIFLTRIMSSITFSLTRLVGIQLIVLALAVAGQGNPEAVKRQAASSATGTLQVFQTTPELFAGNSFDPILT